MTRVVGVRFQQDGKMFYYDALELEMKTGEYVVAETAHGLDLGEVILGIQELEDEQIKTPLPRIDRVASQADIQRATDNRAREMEAYQVGQRKIAEHKLEMKLVSVESTFDNGKLVFYFTANGRVDFRALVKDLASTFKTRIELRQIGVRDEARMLGGLGPCGRPICCGTFLSDFQPVSIKMAKEQNLSLNPTKISGVCGRLMCCLKYEQDQYETTRKRMPRIGREVETPDGTGVVSDLNILKETVFVRIPNGDTTEIREYPLEQVLRPGSVPVADKSEKPEAAVDNTGDIAQEFDLMKENEADEPPRKTRDEQARSGRGKKAHAEKSRSRADGKSARSEDAKKNEGEKKSPADSQSEKNPRSDRKSSAKSVQYGQPVRRESAEKKGRQEAKEQNPAGRAPDAPEKQPAAESAPGMKREVSPVQHSVEKKKGASGKSQGWADALEKALQEADGDQKS